MARILLAISDPSIKNNGVVLKVYNHLTLSGHFVFIISQNDFEYLDNQIGMVNSDVLIALLNSVPEDNFFNALNKIIEKTKSPSESRNYQKLLVSLNGYIPRKSIIFEFDSHNIVGNDQTKTLNKDIENLFSWISAKIDTNNFLNSKKAIKENIETNAPVYIDKAIIGLQTRGTTLNTTGNVYFVVGTLALISCICYVCLSTGQLIDQIVFFDNWKFLIFITIKGLVVVGLFIAMAKFAFTLGKAYIHESLKVKERTHAISFGKFYLDVYKEGVTREDMKDIFRDWNINNQTTAFSTENKTDIDPKYLEGVAKVLEASKDVAKTVGDTIKGG